MTDARTHLKELAQRYAQALVNYHLDPTNDNYSIMCDIHETMYEVAREVANEAGY